MQFKKTKHTNVVDFVTNPMNGVTSRPSSAPRWPTLSSHTHACSPDRAEPLDCWLGCLDWARLIETETTTQISTRVQALQNNTSRPQITSTKMVINPLTVTPPF